ncbi:MAG: LegC family aminotransferase [Pseudomonadota bacterium]
MTKVNDIVALFQQVLSYNDKAIALHEPNFTGNEWQYVKECLDTGWVSSVGKYVDRFEQDLADFTGAKHVIATVNGTAALHVSYLLAGVMRNDEVLVPSLTFVATVNAIAYCGAIPHFIDAEAKHLGIDPETLALYLRDISTKVGNTTVNRLTGRPIRALCVMHTLGHPVDLDALGEIARQYNLALVEDAAEALGSYYKGVHVGHHGLVGTLSFNGNKIITTGGGGAILTNHTELAKKAKHLTTTAKLPHAWEFKHDQIGYNYRLPNINAAIGCAQLETMADRLHKKRLLMQKYQRAFANMPGVTLITEPAYAKSNYWLNALLLSDSELTIRNDLLAALNQNGIMTRPLWNLQHTLAMFQDCPRMPLTTAENLLKNLLQIPSSPQLISHQQEYVT